MVMKCFTSLYSYIETEIDLKVRLAIESSLVQLQIELITIKRLIKNWVIHSGVKLI